MSCMYTYRFWFGFGFSIFMLVIAKYINFIRVLGLPDEQARRIDLGDTAPEPCVQILVRY